MSATTLFQWSRKIHKWLGLALSLVFLLLSVTGIMLLFKTQWGYQPETAKGQKASVEQSLPVSEIIQIAASQGFEDLKSVEDVDRIDFRPNKSVYKVRANSGLEFQIDMSTGEVLSSGQRIDKTLEELHDGSYFGDWFKYIFITLSGVAIILLTLTGYHLWGYPYWRKQESRKTLHNRKNQTA